MSHGRVESRHALPGKDPFGLRRMHDMDQQQCMVRLGGLQQQLRRQLLRDKQTELEKSNQFRLLQLRFHRHTEPSQCKEAVRAFSGGFELRLSRQLLLESYQTL